jgi:hypothetical protein
MSSEQERGLNIILRSYEHEVDDRERRLESTNVFDGLFPPAPLLITLCRLQVQVFYFYRNQIQPEDGCFSRFLSTTCAVIDQIAALIQRDTCNYSMPTFLTHSVILASACLLRLLKSSLSQNIDCEKARSYFFTTLTMLKRLSIDGDDAPAKCAALINQLWNSSKAFKKPDGTEYRALRIRSRLACSPIMDAVWWWRQEFDPHHKQLFPRGDMAGRNRNF